MIDATKALTQSELDALKLRAAQDMFGGAMSRPPLPPFTVETAAQKARMAEDAWNTRAAIVS
jgi:hypothetical protein